MIRLIAVLTLATAIPAVAQSGAETASTPAAAVAPEATPPVAPDSDLARLRAREAAVRAGASSPRAVVIHKSGQAETSEPVPQAGNREPRSFPLPPRSEARPTAGGLQALIAAGAAAPVKPSTGSAPSGGEPPAAATPDETNALAAFQDYRRAHGLAR